MPSSLRSSTKWFVDFETPPDSPSTCGWVDNKHSFWGWNYPLNQHKSEKDTILTLFAAATTQSRCIYTVIFPLLRRGWWSVKGGEGSFSSETWNAPLKKALSLSLFLSRSFSGTAPAERALIGKAIWQVTNQGQASCPHCAILGHPATSSKGLIWFGSVF